MFDDLEIKPERPDQDGSDWYRGGAANIWVESHREIKRDVPRYGHASTLGRKVVFQNISD